MKPADAIRAEGHSVAIIDNQTYVVRPPRASEVLEIAITGDGKSPQASDQGEWSPE